jgi:hypothetical protein
MEDISQAYDKVANGQVRFRAVIKPTKVNSNILVFGFLFISPGFVRMSIGLLGSFPARLEPPGFTSILLRHSFFTKYR